jgi:predicted site-specific integrase-resolvase
MNKLLTIQEACDILNVCTKTLHRYELNGKINPIYTAGGHRRYKKEDIDKMSGAEIEENTTKTRCVIYARVSTGEQKSHGDLERQVGRLTTEAVERKYLIVEAITEVASGMNDKRPKLHKMMDLAIENKIDIVLIEHKDRLTRFMFDYLVKFFNSYGVRIEWTEEILGKTYEQELVEDILSLMASFSAKIYSKRAVNNRKKK